jgi:hypothetical protein
MDASTDSYPPPGGASVADLDDDLAAGLAARDGGQAIGSQLQPATPC